MWTPWSAYRVKYKGISVNKRRVGAKYEEIASDYLKTKKYTIVERNLRTPYGEVDILAKKGAVLIFCEVKYRSSAKCGSPMEAVDVQKQRRICRSALYYCTGKGFVQDMPCRFDVISVYGNGEVEHLENAFEFRY